VIDNFNQQKSKFETSGADLFLTPVRAEIFPVFIAALSCWVLKNGFKPLVYTYAESKENTQRDEKA